MTNEIQTVKQEAESRNGAERTRATRVYVPQVDIYGDEEGIVVLADMPGVDEHNVEITLEKNVLTINGYVSSNVPAGYQLTYGEYGVGDFQRSFTLSNEIDRENIEATVRNGTLRLHLPRAKEARARKIAVKSG